MDMSKKVSAEVSELLPVMAMAAIGGKTGTDDATAAMLRELVGDLLQERRDRKERREKFMANAVEAAKRQKENADGEKRTCSHKNPKGDTRLRGQRLSGTQQICLVCTWCHQEYFSPPLEGQKAPPRDLIPSIEWIGG